MSVLKQACADCMSLVKYHGKVNKIGGREVSNYWCVERNGFVKTGLKECSFQRPHKKKG